MTDFRDRLELELRTAASRQEHRAPTRRRPRPRLGALVPAFALAATVTLIVALMPGDVDPERSVPAPAAAPVPALLQGTFQGETGGPDLQVKESSLRMVNGPSGTSTLLLGFASVSGDRITVRVDPQRTSGDPFPGPLCRGGRVGDAGVYRYLVRGDVLTFRLVEDPCRGRAELLTGSRWKRTD